MKRRLLTLFTICAFAFSLVACGNKAVLHITITGIGDYEIVEYPTDVVNYSHTDNDITVTVNQNKDYDFVVKDSERKEYSFTIKYENKKAEVVTTDDIGLNVSIQ